ncbi:MAG TPA: patatin-like protein, partial [Pyrinomonadaceae bacterium]
PGDEAGEPTEALYQQVSGSEAVYRKLGRMLSRGAEPDMAARDDDAAPLRTRFVIDILSGTSAGGINAVFLAKALANNQEMNELKQMWVEQGDMDVLLNDNASDADINLGPQDPPRSLLNSRRMYYQLLDALQRMDSAAPQQQSRASDDNEKQRSFVSPFVEELDLFTTATDIWGQNINVRLADTLAHERRHLNTFHFRFSSKQADGVGQNDFTAEFNPFLAFAARVTSAHPAPFEPMKLADIDEVLDRHEAYRDVAGFRSDDPRWEMFFEEYLQRPEGDGPKMRGQTAEDRQQMRKLLAEKFRQRPFSDGGVLDNSPFSFAIDKLQYRHTRLPVDRKLIYIEPVPEHPEKNRTPDSQPDALVNGWLSLSTLPRYQFIRDDLQRLLERNRLIERVNRILKGVERDEVERMRKHSLARGADLVHQDQAEAPLSSYEFGQKTIGEMIERMGSAWGGYQRLRVAETTDELVMMIGRAAGFDEQSDEYMAIRYLVRTWRFENYDAYGEGFKGHLDNELPEAQRQALQQAGAETKDSENLFLYQYDLKWRLRRLKFVLTKAEEISCLDEHAFDLLGIASDAPEVKALLLSLGEQGPEQEQETPAATEAVSAGLLQERVRRELRTIKYQLSERLRDMHIARHQLLSRPSPRVSQSGPAGVAAFIDGNPLEQAIEKLEISMQDILRILDKGTDPERQKVAEDILLTKKKQFDLFLGDLNDYLRKVLDDVAARIRGEHEFAGHGILESPDQLPNPLTPEYLVRRTLRYFYENFDRYDVISYPVLYSTNVGEETDVVEVFRISPEDAQVLIKDEALRRRKLAGTSLGNFGAFFNRDFRTNDILWGRLDCADRIITALLSSASPQTQEEQQKLEDTKRELVEEASRAIIAEELSASEKTNLHGLLAAALVKAEQGVEQAEFVPELEKLLKQLPAMEKLIGQHTEGAPDLSKLRGFLSDCL